VADHGDLPAGPLQLGDLAGLVAGKDLCDDLSDAQLSADSLGSRLVVTGKHYDVDAFLAKRRNRGGGGWAWSVADADQSRGAAVHRNHNDRAALRGHLVSLLDQTAKADL